MLTIRFKLSQAGQRAATLLNVSAKHQQELEVRPDDPLFAKAVEIAEFDQDGNGTVSHMDTPRFDKIPTVSEALNAVATTRRAIEEEKMADETRRENDRHAEWAKLLSIPVDQRVYDSWGTCRIIHHPDFKGDEPAYEKWVSEAKERVKRGQEAARCAKKKAEELAKAEKDALETERKNWVEANGTPKLKSLMKEDIEGWQKVYRDERLKIEMPEWKFYTCVCGETVAPRAGSVTEDHLYELESERKKYPKYEIKLAWLSHGSHTGSCDCGEEWVEMKRILNPRMVLESEWRGLDIIKYMGNLC